LAESCELQKFPGPQSHLLSGIRPRSTAPFDRFSTIILCAYHIEWVALSSWPHFPLSLLQTASAHTLLIHLAKCNPITSIRLWFPESLIFLLLPADSRHLLLLFMEIRTLDLALAFAVGSWRHA